MKTFLFALCAAAIVPAGAHAVSPAQHLILAPDGHLLAKSPTQACQDLAKRTDFDGKPPIRRLDDLPKAWLEHAVYRVVDGCPVREIVYRGQVYYVPPTGQVATTAQPVERQTPP